MRKGIFQHKKVRENEENDLKMSQRTLL